MQIYFWLIVQVLTGAGFTEFDIEYPDLISCQRAMVHTVALQVLKESERSVRIECREWPLSKPVTKRKYRT